MLRYCKCWDKVLTQIFNALTAKTYTGHENVFKVQDGPPHYHAKYGEARTSRIAEGQKILCILFVGHVFEGKVCANDFASRMFECGNAFSTVG